MQKKDRSSSAGAAIKSFLLKANWSHIGTCTDAIITTFVPWPIVGKALNTPEIWHLMLDHTESHSTACTAHTVTLTSGTYIHIYLYIPGKHHLSVNCVEKRLCIVTNWWDIDQTALDQRWRTENKAFPVFIRSCEGYVFTHRGGGVCLSACWYADTKAPGRRNTPPPGADSPSEQTPSQEQTPRERWPLLRTVRILLECILVSTFIVLCW